jgi:5'-nucleotidase
MQKSTRTRLTIGLGSLLGLGLVAAPLATLPANATPDGTGVVINEAYLSGGSAGAAFTNKFVELYNPGATSVSLSGWSLQYRPATGTNAAVPQALSGSIPAHGYYLVEGGSNGANGAALPTPDAALTGFNPSGTTGTILLADVASGLDPEAGSVAGAAHVVDALGYGASNTFEGALATSPSGNTDVKSFTRTNFADSDDNSADFTLSATITPQNSGGAGDPGDPEQPTVATIEEIQGPGDTSPFAGHPVTTRGIVTAAYPTGGFDGYYIQTAGTGGALDLATHTASDAVFVYSPQTVDSVMPGDYVEVTGEASEFFGLTEVNVNSAAALTKLPADPSAALPLPATVGFPAAEAQRESLEGMLIAPQGPFTVTDVYQANQYGEVGLAADSSPLRTPTSVGEVGSPEYTAAVAAAAAKAVTLDDGASTNFFKAPGNSDPLPYLTVADPVRVGAAVKFTTPVVLDYRNSLWGFQPLGQLNPGDASTVQPVTFSNTRENAPESVGGDIALGTFNVLNYFPTTGDERTGCTFYEDREGNPITVENSDAPGCGVRGAATQESLARQQAKIVSAINSLGADVVSLEEIENSAKLGQDRDAGVSTLVAALNVAAGGPLWAFDPSPTLRPDPADEDVIRTAFIYKPALVEPIGQSVILTGDPAFADAREPDAQAFRPVGGSADDTFVVISNHLKSKSGDGATGDNADTGQGAYTGDRVRQATALVAFADSMKARAGTDKVFLVGDFNSYAKEDPIRVVEAAGYISQGAKTGKETYQFDGAIGSLDYIFASPSADAIVTGQDVWNINSVESVATEYSRFNYNPVNLYEAGPFRSSDHDPLLVGLGFTDVPAPGGDGQGTGDNPGTGNNAPGAGNGGTTAGSSPAGSGVLASTGSDLSPWLASVLVLLMAGAALLVWRGRRASA